LVLLLHWVVLRDTIYVYKHQGDDLVGTIAFGFVGAWATITVGLFYLAIHTFESLSFMFWFFAGLFAARREKLQMARVKVQSVLSGKIMPMKLKVGGAV
jgi:hypothetical protein